MDKKKNTKEEQLRKELHQAIDELDIDMLYVIAESIGLR